MSCQLPYTFLVALLLALSLIGGCSPTAVQPELPTVKLGVREFGQPFFEFGNGQSWSYTHSGRRFKLTHQHCTIGGVLDTNVTPHTVNLEITSTSPVSIQLLDLDLTGCTGGKINDGVLMLQDGTHSVKIEGTFKMWHEVE